jgi:hypothetical protein
VVRQMGRKRDDKWFETGLMLAAGDLRTVLRMKSIKSVGLETAALPFDRYQWLLPIPGLWHLKFNMLQLLSTVHKRAGQQTDISSLQYALDKWDRKRLITGEAFKDLEELIIHCYYSRVVGLLMVEHRKIMKDSDPDKFKEYMYTRTVEEWKCLLSNIHGQIHPDPVTLDEECEHDEVWANERRFCAHVETYILLNYAIKHGDLGLLRRALVECAIMFQAPQGHKGSYASALLGILHMVDSNAADTILQDAILTNCLDNLRGEEDSNLAKDLLLEILNGEIKGHKKARDSSTKEPSDLIDQCALSGQIAQYNKLEIEKTYYSLQDGRHPLKPAEDDVTALAWELASHTLRPRRETKAARYAIHVSPDLFAEGIKTLEANISAYNKQARSGVEWEGEDVVGAAEDEEAARLLEPLVLTDIPSSSAPGSPDSTNLFNPGVPDTMLEFI